ncbi:MAG: methyltransferase [Polyangiaceae bacterium]
MARPPEHHCGTSSCRCRSLQSPAPLRRQRGAAINAAMPFAPGSLSKLNERDLARFPGESLFDRVGRAVCRAGCLPRKELYEAWEVARRVRRRLRGGRVVELACGHALAAHLMILLDDSSPCALAVDVRPSPSAGRLAEELVRTWPRLEGRVVLQTRPLAGVQIAPTDVVLSVHACGSLTDDVLDKAIGARASLAVLPCCHDARQCDSGGLGGWLDHPLAIDVTRAQRLRAAGYAVHTQLIPAAITPKNRLLIGVS